MHRRLHVWSGLQNLDSYSYRPAMCTRARHTPARLQALGTQGPADSLHADAHRPQFSPPSSVRPRAAVPDLPAARARLAELVGVGPGRPWLDMLGCSAPCVGSSTLASGAGARSDLPAQPAVSKLACLWKLICMAGHAGLQCPMRGVIDARFWGRRTLGPASTSSVSRVWI